MLRTVYLARLSVIVTAVFFFPLMLHDSFAQGQLSAQHGDWQIRCDTPPGARNKQCFLIQHVTAEDRDNVGLSVMFIKTADKKSYLMRIVTPLGVLLPAGLGLRVDGVEVGDAEFLRCRAIGCVVQFILQDALLKQLSQGKLATFIIFQTPEEGIGIPISLNGFKDGFDALK